MNDVEFSYGEPDVPLAYDSRTKTYKVASGGYVLAGREQLAYAAGIVDGEGCITIPKRLGTIILRVAMGHQDTVERLFSMFNAGCLRTVSSQWSTMYVWENTGKDAIYILRCIYPWMLTKAHEADIAFEFEALGPRTRGVTVSPTILDARRSCYQRLRDAKPRNAFREN